jgi:hypothetical protein
MVKTWKPTVGGILAIIAGALQVIIGIVVAVAGTLLGGALIRMGWLGAIGAPVIILGIVAIVGGIYALRRKIWGLALAGSICALFLFPPLFILGILAIVFVALGKSEFE